MKSKLNKSNLGMADYYKKFEELIEEASEMMEPKTFQFFLKFTISWMEKVERFEERKTIKRDSRGRIREERNDDGTTTRHSYHDSEPHDYDE